MEIDINHNPEEVEDDYPDLETEERNRSGCALIILIIVCLLTLYLFDKWN